MASTSGHKVAFAASVLAALATSAPTEAFQSTSTHHHNALELANTVGGQARGVRRYRPSGQPRAASAAWQTFRREHAGSWLARWDAATGVPTRIWGRGIAAPGSMASPAEAERVARNILRRHIELLAPGSAESQLELVTNELAHGQRTVAFLQRHRGLEVVGGQLSFRFKNDRLFVIASEALPRVDADVPQQIVTADEAARMAHGWIAKDAGSALVETVGGSPMVLPLIGDTRVLGYRTVVRVDVRAEQPIGRWAVYLDATTGQPVARQQLLRFAEGTLLYHTPERYPAGGRLDFPATFASVTVDGQNDATNELGMVTFADGAPVEVIAQSTGSSVQVINKSGPAASVSLQLDPGGSVQWDASDNEPVEAQLTTFVHAQLAREHARTLANIAWLNKRLTANVNIGNEACNAYYDGTSINFMSKGGQCENTGRLADVVHHEFGHGFHHHSIVPGSGSFDSALSEGLSDYFASNMANDPAMGRGFFGTDEPLRHIDPELGEHVWPDDIHSDPHRTGLIIGGALWDLRKALIAEHGDSEGVLLTQQLFFEGMRHASDIPTMYVEVLAADDDDGDLSNGTPHVCTIIETFGAHGLRAASVSSPDLSVEPEDANAYEVAVKVEGLYPQCPTDNVTEARVVWSLERTPHQRESITMSGGPEAFKAEIPKQTAGEVVSYHVDVDLEVGTSMSFPDNEADPKYAFFVGNVTPIYCTDFENDPEADGWTHGLISGSSSEGADDWTWGVPQSTAESGDPDQAYSGTKVFGNDLGGGNFNGTYQPDKVNYAASPVIDVSGHAHVRLQYRRWLRVEDGLFDQATIYANDKKVWSNYASPASSDPQEADTHHVDREWRFHDVSLTDYLAEDTVQIKFEIASDQHLEMGGWAIDDFCIVAYDGEIPGYEGCGNGRLDVGETCDDGNRLPGDGCDTFCQTEDDEVDMVVNDALPNPGGGCECGVVSNVPDGDDTRGVWALLGLAALAVRRRRRS